MARARGSGLRGREFKSRIPDFYLKERFNGSSPVAPTNLNFFQIMSIIEKIFLVFVAIVVLMLGAASLLSREKSFSEDAIVVNGQKIKVEIADTAYKARKGLSGRESLAANSGMLFLFNKKDEYVFTMKEMKFSIDLILISGDEVRGVIKNLRVPENDKYYPQYFSSEPIDKALEIKAGMAEVLGIKKGTQIQGLAAALK